MMQAVFFALAQRLFAGLQGSESLLLSLTGEQSTFVSFNQNKIRQAGQVERLLLEMRLIQHSRHASWQMVLSGDPEVDLQEGNSALQALRELLPKVPEDPYLALPEQACSSGQVEESRLPPVQQMVEDILHAGRRMDLVGLLATGSILGGFAASNGQRNWFQRSNFSWNWSVHAGDSLAFQYDLAGFDWQASRVEKAMQAQSSLTSPAARQRKSLTPGAYRAYLEPAAVRALLELAGKDGFSARAWQKGTGCLSRVLRGEPLSPLVTWRELPAEGAGPAFDRWGFAKLERRLVVDGRPLEPLVNPRSAQEFGLSCTGAGEWEQPENLWMSPGSVPTTQALEFLGTGVWLTQLHYLNPANFAAGGFTGLTRFAAFWVENGKPVHSLPGMRVNGNFVELFGQQLLGLTQECELLLDRSTLSGRSTRVFYVPGAFLGSLSLT